MKSQWAPPSSRRSQDTRSSPLPRTTSPDWVVDFVVSTDQDKDQQAARLAALRALTVRPRSVAELRQRLERRFDEAAVEPVLRKLTDQGLLNDDAFAEAWRQSREHSRPRAAALVRRELLQHGVQAEVADRAVDGMDDEGAAQRAARGYMRRWQQSDPQRSRQRMWAYLMRRGFGADATSHAIQAVAPGRDAESTGI